MEDIKKELNKLWEHVIQSDDVDIKADENSYLDSLDDYEYEDIDQVINNYLFF